MSDIAFVYESVPGLTEYILVNFVFAASFKPIPTLGPIIPYPSCTIPFTISGVFKICAILPISSKPLFSTSSVSLSNVITYLIFGNFSISIVFTLNSLSLFFRIYSLNWFNKPLFLSHPK